MIFEIFPSFYFVLCLRLVSNLSRSPKATFRNLPLWVHFGRFFLHFHHMAIQIWNPISTTAHAVQEEKFSSHETFHLIIPGVYGLSVVSPEKRNFWWNLEATISRSPNSYLQIQNGILNTFLEKMDREDFNKILSSVALTQFKKH